MFDHIFLTGYNKFHGVGVNPTEEMIKAEEPKKRKGVTCRVLEVAAEDVDAYIDECKKRVDEHQGKVLHLHLGVGPNLVYHLENVCYNQKDFRAPDNKNYQPLNEPIYPNEPLDRPIHCKIDLKEVAKKLSVDYKVAVSDDPGRYLCNYVYYRTAHDISDRNDHCYSLFVHVPPLDVTPH